MNKGIRFTDEFKQDAVAQVVERSYAFSEVAERLGISAKSLYTWKGQFSKPPHVRAEVLDQAAEIKRLKRELARVTEERNILKKRPRTSRENLSGFYAWLKEPLSSRGHEDVRQTELIQQAWTDSGKVYGYRKLHDDLLD